MLLNFVPMATIVSESDYDSSCSSITVPDSTRSWISNLSFGSNRLSSVSVQSTPADLVPLSLYASQKPHKANQAAWEAMRQLRAVKDGRVGLEHFRLLRRLGSGDIGNVYLCQIRNIPVPAKGGLARPPPPECMYAMKVVDREALAVRNKLGRAEMEKEILGMLDHPFLPTLYAEFEASHYSCLVMEFCPGGDLYAARQRLPGKRFSVSAAKFYAAETILAIEYLHMMGIVYRDLKPENVLVREDGHIMLSDFDLCLKCEVVPKLLRSQTTKYHKRHAITKVSSSSSSPSSPTPSCYSISSSPMQPVLSCFSKSSRKKKSPKTITTITEQAHSNDHHHDHHDHDSDQEYYDPELVAEPIEARSKSFVGTHEYLAPEVISGQGHGSAVDWWTLGVFLYELLYGKTPFKGENNEQTLINILKQPLSFPRSYSNVRSCSEEEEEMWRVEDLIRKLLVKNPKKRMGGLKGSVEIKRHDFFKGVNWALIRSVKPPQNPNCNTNDSDNRIKSKIRANYLPKLLSKKEREEPYQIPQHHQHQYPHHSHHHHHHVEYF